MSWKFNSTEAVFVQIARHLRCDIVRGKYKPDEQIPPVRQLAYDAAVNPNTMQKALALLENEGLLHSKATIGRFVTSDTAVIEDAKLRIRHDVVIHWLEEAESLGITPKELIDCINDLKKEETHDEYTCS